MRVPKPMAPPAARLWLTPLSEDRKPWMRKPPEAAVASGRERGPPVSSRAPVLGTAQGIVHLPG